MLGLELARLQFDHHVAAQLEVVEQQVDEKLLAAHVQQHLPPDESKARTQLQQEIGDVLYQRILDLAFLCFIAQAEEIEAVRIFQRLDGQIGLRCRQALIEVGDGFARALQQAGFDMDVQHIPRPAIFDGSTGIGQALR
ncbi:hypothetical protein D3C71_1597750 [compost metagenome]